MPTLRLLTVNARTAHLDHSALAARISAATPDVACVHGSPSLLRWRSISAALARRAGLVVVGGGRTGGGNLLMSDLGVDSNGTRELIFADEGGLHPAGAALAMLARLGSPFVLVGARLQGAGDAQRSQLAQLQRAIDGLDPSGAPVILCVDDAGSGAAVELQQGRTAAGPGVFVDQRIAVGASDEGVDGVVTLTLPG